MAVIKIGNLRINTEQIAYIEEELTNTLRKAAAGHVYDNYEYSDDCFIGTKVYIYFVATSENGTVQVRLYTEEAEQFLSAYDHLIKAVDVTPKPES